MFDDDDVRIFLMRFGHYEEYVSAPLISPSYLLNKNHYITTEDASSLWFQNTRENDLSSGKQTLTTLRHVYLGFKGTYKMSICQL